MSKRQRASDAPSTTVAAVPIAEIVVEEGFNPRAGVEAAEQRRLEHSIAERGILQPVLVEPREDGNYTLIDGHRRLDAAFKAGMTEVPVSIRKSDEEGANLVDAVLANQLHAHLNPLEEALACRRLRDGGLTRAQVAAKLEMSQALVKERLTILELPDELWPKVASGEIPMLAVKALADVAKVHPELAVSAVGAVLSPSDYEPYTWAEVADGALEVAVLSCESLPAGLFLASRSYPLETFSRSEKASKDLTAYAKLSGHELSHVRFDSELVEQARLLGAAHRVGWDWLITGQDVAERLAEDAIAKALKGERARERREREAARAGESGRGGQQRAEQPQREESEEERQWRAEKEARAARDAERAEQERVVQYNLDLGVKVAQQLSKLKVEERVLRILASVNIGDDLRGLAMRGARLCLPGWPVQSRQKNGRLKTAYLDAEDAEQRASRLLSEAKDVGEIAGRALTLVALAALADEGAIARSRRSYYELRFHGPWAGQAERDMYAIVRERIKEGVLPVLDGVLEERIAHAEEQAREQQELRAAGERLEALGELDGLDEAALEAALHDAQGVWGSYDARTVALRERIEVAREGLKSAAPLGAGGAAAQAEEEEDDPER